MAVKETMTEMLMEMIMAIIINLKIQREKRIEIVSFSMKINTTHWKIFKRN